MKINDSAFVSLGRDPRAMDARGPVSGQRGPMSGGMPGPGPHNMGPNAPPPSRPVMSTALDFITVRFKGGTYCMLASPRIY